MANDNRSYPDISGVFNIDDSKIPTKIIEKPQEKKTAAPTESILLRSETRAQTAQEEKRRKTEVKVKKKAAKRKVFRQRMVLAGAVLVVLLALVLLIRGAVLEKRKPVVALTPVTRADVTAHYDTEGSVLSQQTDALNRVLYAVFVENDYDVYGLQKGQRATVTMGEDVTVTGVVEDIRKEESGSDIISRLIAVFSGAGFSTASNYTVFISLDESSLLEENATVRISVTTGIAENVLTVPAAAVFKEDGQHYVWVYKSFGKKLKRQDVSIGLEADGVVEIKKGLSEEDTVVKDVVSENKELYNNVKVRLLSSGE